MECVLCMNKSCAGAGNAVMQAFVAACWCATHDREQDCSCSSNDASQNTSFIQLYCPKYLQAAPEGVAKQGCHLCCRCSAHSLDIAVKAVHVHYD